MKGPKTKIAPRPRGRPRSEHARQEILEAAYKLLRDRGFNAVGSHEIAQAAGVSSATLYRWWKSKEEILFDACFERMKPILAIPETGSGLTRLRRYVLRAAEFLVSEEGAVMARVFTGIHEDKRLRQGVLGEICQAQTSDPTQNHRRRHCVLRTEVDDGSRAADRCAYWTPVLPMAAGTCSA